jgi:hypothetical protein
VEGEGLEPRIREGEWMGADKILFKNSAYEPNFT